MEAQTQTSYRRCRPWTASEPSSRPNVGAARAEGRSRSLTAPLAQATTTTTTTTTMTGQDFPGRRGAVGRGGRWPWQDLQALVCGDGLRPAADSRSAGHGNVETACPPARFLAAPLLHPHFTTNPGKRPAAGAAARGRCRFMQAPASPATHDDAAVAAALNCLADEILADVAAEVQVRTHARPFVQYHVRVRKQRGYPACHRAACSA
jgi:hypothetical protein